MKGHSTNYDEWYFLNPAVLLVEATLDKLCVMISGAYSGICPGGGLNFFLSMRWAQHPLGPENPLKSIDFTGPEGAHSPIPLKRPLDDNYMEARPAHDIVGTINTGS